MRRCSQTFLAPQAMIRAIGKTSSQRCLRVELADRSPFLPAPRYSPFPLPVCAVHRRSWLISGAGELEVWIPPGVGSPDHRTQAPGLPQGARQAPGTSVGRGGRSVRWRHRRHSGLYTQAQPTKRAARLSHLHFYRHSTRPVQFQDSCMYASSRSTSTARSSNAHSRDATHTRQARRANRGSPAAGRESTKRRQWLKRRRAEGHATRVAGLAYAKVASTSGLASSTPAPGLLMPHAQPPSTHRNSLLTMCGLCASA
jgi:hypothetical protein